MRSRIIVSFLGALLVLLGSTDAARAVTVGYDFQITTFYQFGDPSDLTFSDFGSASPDTGFWTVTNNGASTFSGEIGQVAVSALSGDSSYSHVVTLNPGDSVTFAVNDESSNVGGFNGPFDNGSPQPGVKITLAGTVSLGADNILVNLSVFDSDIHSGVFQTNPFGVLLDNYVLQGGDPFGRDTNDAFEVAQAPGHFRFFQSDGGATVPEPGTLVLLSTGLIGLWAWRRKLAV